jgi:RNA polymerase sigma-70 factor, ECF subfamily
MTVLLPRLRRYALRLTCNASAADDLVQETITRGLEKIHLWQPGTDLRAWLFVILHNLYVSGVRRAVREAAAIKFVLGDSAGAPPQTDRLELHDLQRSLAKLRAEQRAVLLLIGVEGSRYGEVASFLEIPVGTVRSRLARGRASLRLLTDQQPAPRKRRRQSRRQAAA